MQWHLGSLPLLTSENTNAEAEPASIVTYLIDLLKNIGRRSRPWHELHLWPHKFSDLKMHCRMIFCFSVNCFLKVRDYCSQSTDLLSCLSKSVAFVHVQYRHILQHQRSFVRKFVATQQKQVQYFPGLTAERQRFDSSREEPSVHLRSFKWSVRCCCCICLCPCSHPALRGEIIPLCQVTLSVWRRCPWQVQAAAAPRAPRVSPTGTPGSAHRKT